MRSSCANISHRARLAPASASSSWRRSSAWRSAAGCRARSSTLPAPTAPPSPTDSPGTCSTSPSRRGCCCAAGDGWRWREADVTSGRSLRLDVGLLDDRPPLVELGLVVGEQRLRGLLLARRDLVAEITEALLHGRVGERLDHRGVELREDLGRQSLPRPQPVPARD